MSYFQYTVKAHAMRQTTGKTTWSALAEFTSPVELHDHEILDKARYHVSSENKGIINMMHAARTGDVLIERMFVGRD